MREKVKRSAPPEARDPEQLTAALVHHGVPEGFARDVAETFFVRSPQAALVQLYAGGWEPFIHHHNGERVLQLRRCLTRGASNGETEGKA